MYKIIRYMLNYFANKFVLKHRQEINNTIEFWRDKVKESIVKLERELLRMNLHLLVISYTENFRLQFSEFKTVGMNYGRFTSIPPPFEFQLWNENHP